ncbi:hypothetical protein MHM83_15065 [Tenacibaculum sp. Mcav3-52]|uniref:hypothetical protein n=1 Tax=unclassified Tenacibaculum TaxID=2635139 RepID=UPI001EF1ADD4|nr:MULTISPECIES: hypothetical protein [unclassified Tenacibaculum]MCG7503187.1 hypothetical protein [Tenacibaculum sp. Mcav3-52]MCO7186024.1 hypothetical protein [Tenacibaculum sp. XPcli2-G]BFF37009.1 hypothetical protein BACT7_18710 [Tenacibaculum mesophilum]BFF40380.1 hypothetical protein BACY1_21850 [Tenacibaculum mesophilum]
MSNQVLTTDFLEIKSSSVISGNINCSSAAPAIASDPRSAIFIALTNPSYDSIKYAIYNNQTGHVIASGSLSKGNSRSVIVPAQDVPNIVRIQNQSPCDTSGITPILSFSASIQR